MSCLTVENSENTKDLPAFMEKVLEFLVFCQKQKPAKSSFTKEVLAKLVYMPGPENKTFYVVKDKDSVIGCLCLYTSKGKDFASFGLFEIDVSHEGRSEAASSLILAAEEKSIDLGRSKLNGPIDYNIWLPYRVKTKGFEKNFSWEPNYPKEYCALLEKAGLEKEFIFVSEFVEEKDSSYRKFEDIQKKCEEDGFRFKKFSGVDIFGKYLRELYELSLSSFDSSSALYEPLSYEAFVALYVPIFRQASLDFAYLCLDQNNKLAGFLYAFMDSIDGKLFGIMKTIAVSDSHRGKGLSNALYYKTAANLVEHGAEVICNALIKENGIAFSYSKEDKKTISEYAVFSKSVKG